MKYGIIAVVVVMAGAYFVLSGALSNALQAHGVSWEPTSYEPYNVCDFGDCSGLPGLSGSGEFDNKQNFENEAKADQTLKIEQNVKCEHVHTCNPILNVEKSLTTADEREYKTDQEYTGGSGGEHKERLTITIKFDGDKDDYGEGQVQVNSVKKNFDVSEEIDKHGNPLHIPYDFIGYGPEESKVCVKNLDTDEKNCKDVYQGQHEVTLKFPD